MWSGSAVLALLVTLLTLSIRQDNVRETAQLNAPLIGDVYTIKLGYKHYTLERVVRISGDTAFVRGTDRTAIGGVLKLVRLQSDTSVRFLGELKAYTRQQRRDLERSGTIHQIHRVEH